MLDRYRKTGGFAQLLTLLETCGSAKQEKFLQMIREQDENWAKALEARIMTVDRVFSWPAEVVAELLPTLQDLTIATASRGLNDAQKEILYRTMSSSQKRKIDELAAAGTPSAAEVATTLNKILIEARKAITEGRIRLEKFDPDAAVPDDIEERLKKGPSSAKVTAEESSGEDGGSVSKLGRNSAANFDLASTVAPLGPMSPDASRAEAQLRDENGSLKKKLISVVNENGILKQELSRLMTKLEQIKKMAA
jgi:hypothetical protein